MKAELATASPAAKAAHATRAQGHARAHRTKPADEKRVALHRADEFELGELDPRKLRTAIRACLTPDLLKGEYKKQWTPDKPKSWGHCYVASETYYHLMGGKAAGLKAFWVKHEGGTHIFLRDREGKVIDPTGDQFRTPAPYERAKAFGWLTGETPSERCRILTARVLEKLAESPE